MPSYLVQVSYTIAAVAAFIESPQDRTDAIRKTVERLGGKLEKLYLSFGDYDVVGIYDMPNNVSAAAFAVAIKAGGVCKDVKTTPLISTKDGVTVLKKAATSGYVPVTAKK
jgi:uncharacterized protein with GYD domain